MNILKIHDVSPKQLLEKILLFVIFFLGTSGIIFFKLQEFDALWSALWAVVILTLYLLASAIIGHIKIEPESIGDNCYYLGFLFTLTSLAVTLYQLDNSGSDEAIGEIISGFGVALASTIFGVLFRVALMQLKVDFVARDLKERTEVLAVSRRFRAQLSESLRIHKSFAIEVAQHEVELLDKTSKALEIIVEEIQKRFEKKAELILEQFKESIKIAAEIGSIAVADGITASVVNVKNEFSVAVKKISEDFNQLSKSQKNLISNFSQLQTLSDASTSSFMDALTQIGIQLSQTQDSMRNSSIAMVQSFEDTHVVLRETHESISRTVVALTNNLDLQILEGRISNVLNDVVKTSQDSLDSVSRLKDKLDFLDANVQEVSGGFDLSCDSLSTAIKALSHEVKGGPVTKGPPKDL